MRAKKSKSRPQLVDVLIGAYRRRILGLLLLNPEKSFYVREMERLTGVPAGSLHRELKLLTDAELLARSTSGNQVRYQADRANPIFEELAGILRKTAGLADVLRELLAPLSNAVRLAFVFGSVAQAKERAESDVDVMVVGTVGFPEVVQALAPARDRLRREINPVAMTAEAFSKKLAAGDRFVSRVAREPKIFSLEVPMSLQNLLKIGQLKEHPADAEEIQRLLAAAERNLSDAAVAAVSFETRYDAAYRAITQTCLSALMAHGFRPDTNRPGHHVTLIQALPLTLGVDATRVIVLDALRRKRNLGDYTGEDIDEASVDACIAEAKRLLGDALEWLTTHRPNLITPKL